MLALVLSPGNFHASTAYLPTSFAMYTAMLGAASFMNWVGGTKTAAGIAWFAAGGIIGWPFAMALSAPFLVEEALLGLMALSDTKRFVAVVKRVALGVGAAVGILVSINLPIGIMEATNINSLRASTVSSIPSSTGYGASLYHGTSSSTTSSLRLVDQNSMAQSPGLSISRTWRSTSTCGSCSLC